MVLIVNIIVLFAILKSFNFILKCKKSLTLYVLSYTINMILSIHICGACSWIGIKENDVSNYGNIYNGVKV